MRVGRISALDRCNDLKTAELFKNHDRSTHHSRKEWRYTGNEQILEL
jgi:hypothetical protein